MHNAGPRTFYRIDDNNGNLFAYVGCPDGVDAVQRRADLIVSALTPDDRLLDAARKIIRNYEETGWRPADSTDPAVMLAVDYLKRFVR